MLNRKLILLLLLVPGYISAQVPSDSLSFLKSNYQNKKLTTLFDKQLSTYNLNTGFQYNLSYDKLFIGVNEEFKSTVVKSSQKNIKDEQNLSILGEYTFDPSLQLGMYLDNNIYSDDRTLAINQASNTQISLYTKYAPKENIKLIPYGGVSENKQIGEVDRGYIYGTEAVVNRLQVSDFEIYSSLKYQNEDINPRKNTIRFANIALVSQLDESFNNTIWARYSENRKDFYFDADSITLNEFNISKNIQSRIENNYFLQNRLLYISPESDLVLDAIGSVGWREIDRDTRYISTQNINATTFDTRIEELKLDLSSSAQYRSDNFNGLFKFTFSERDEKHFAKEIDGANEVLFNQKENSELQKNNKSQQTSLSLSGSYSFSPKDFVMFSLYHRKLVYDTPSEDNFDDRDELLSIMRLTYLHRLTPLFDISLNLEGSLNQTVYIFSERSSNNNVKRILKLSSTGTYRGKNLISKNDVEVSANYTVYDYEDLNPNFNSFSFRQFVVRDSTGFNLTRRTSAAFLGYLKLSEQGDFNWSQFANKPVRFLEELYLEPKLYYDHYGLRLGVGMRFFSLTTYNYDENNNKQIASEYTSIGPLSEVSYYAGNRVIIKLYGYYEFIEDGNNPTRELANLNMRVIWNL